MSKQEKPVDDPRSALSLYLDELLRPADSPTPGPGPGAAVEDREGEAAAPDRPAQRVLAAGPVAADDSRHYVFSVAGLFLALPASRISGEREGPFRLHGAPGDLVGPVEFGDGRIPVVDLSRLILADQGSADHPSPAGTGGMLVLLDRDSWGLWLHKPGELEQLDLDAVLWRGPRSSRPWLAGTLAARRCVLLDLDQIAAMIE